MKGVTLTALVAAYLATTSSALYLAERTDTVPAVVGLNVQRKHVHNPAKRDLQRRQQVVSETLDNLVRFASASNLPGSHTDLPQGTLYFANVSLGTPGQSLRLHIDTGSSDLWTNAPDSKLCQNNQAPCSDSGTYDSSASSTYKLVSSDFNISYVDGSGALGNYATDTLSIGGQQLKGLQFGIGLRSASPEGILGIGYTSNEVQVNRNAKQAYPNVPQYMADNGLTKSNAYSLWLDDLEANTGSILFGGIDTDEFHGTLGTLPVQQAFGAFTQFVITLSGISSTVNGKTQTFSQDLPTPVLLDSGSSVTYLPNDLINALYGAWNVQYDNQQQLAVVDCKLANSQDTIDFTFTSPKISVPASELVIPAGTDQLGNTVCIFGINPAHGNTPVLGDTFLRSAYVVYDLGNNEISLAQTNFNATTSHVLEIGTGNNAVPSASVVANPIQASPSETGGARIAPITATGTGTGSTSRPTSKSAAVSSIHMLHTALFGISGIAAALALV